MTPASPFQFGDEICVAQVGVYPNPQAGVDQVIDAIALNTMEAAASARLANGGGDYLVDFDHDSENPEKSSVAAAWGTDVSRQGNRLMMKVRFTDLGSESLRNGRFRYVSPVFSRVEQFGGKRVRPIELHSVALTNAPVMRDLGPIANRMAAGARILNSAQPLVFGGKFRMGRQEAADEIKRLVNRYQREKGWNFERAWNHVTLTEPLLNGIFHLSANDGGFLMNRVPGLSQEQLWKIVRDTQAAVRERLFRQFDNYEVHTILVRGGVESLHGFVEQLQTVMREQTGGDFDAAWTLLQRTHPVDFANFILGTSEAADAQRLDQPGEETKRRNACAD